MRIYRSAGKCEWAREDWVRAASFGRTNGHDDVRSVFGERAMDVRRARLSLRRSRHDT